MISMFALLGISAVFTLASALSNPAEKITVMVNGIPGKMAIESAIVCLDRGYNVLPFGFTGPTNKFSKVRVEGHTRSMDIELVKGPGHSEIASNVLKRMKETHPNLVIIDYTHPSAVLGNLQCYVDEGCDFVMGTTGEDAEKMHEIFGLGKNLAVIAPNMAKQIVALQASIINTAKRFPKAFKDYTLTVTESHQSTKADTSGTAKVRHPNPMRWQSMYVCMHSLAFCDV
jgi:4-hydroxy-tetrahydrodipicolinate reductase